MIKKYMIYNRMDELVEQFATYELNYDVLSMKYPEHNIYCSLSSLDEHAKTYEPLLIEIKSELPFVEMFEELKKETIKVIDYISKEFEIQQEYIRIYFNSKNGFYILVRNVASGIHRGNSISMYQYMKGLVSHINEELACSYIDLDDYGIHRKYMLYDSQNVITGYYVKRISKEKLENLSYLKFIEYCSHAMYKEKFLGVRKPKSKPSLKLSEIMETMLPVSDKEIKQEIEEYFETNLNRRKLNSKENLDYFYECAAYEPIRKYALYMFNKMFTELKKEDEALRKREIMQLWIKELVVECALMLNRDKNMKLFEMTSYYCVLVSEADDTMVYYEWSMWGIQNTFTFLISTIEEYGIIEVPVDEFDLEDVYLQIANMDRAIKGYSDYLQ